MKKIIIDTSILITYLIAETDSINQILEMHKNGDIELYYSRQTFAELQLTLKKPNLKKYLEPVKSKISRFVAWYKYNAEEIKVSQIVKICRDPKDDMFVQLAKEINADYIISGDKDLLVLKLYENTKILTPFEFIKEYQLS